MGNKPKYVGKKTYYRNGDYREEYVKWLYLQEGLNEEEAEERTKAFIKKQALLSRKERRALKRQREKEVLLEDVSCVEVSDQPEYLH